MRTASQKKKLPGVKSAYLCNGTLNGTNSLLQVSSVLFTSNTLSEVLKNLI